MQAVKSAVKEIAGTIGVLFVYFWLCAIILIVIGNGFKIEIIPPLVLNYLIWWTIISVTACFIICLLWRSNQDQNNHSIDKLAHE